LFRNELSTYKNRVAGSILPKAGRIEVPADSYLNPNTGRFWSMDPDFGRLGDPPSLNKYSYSQCDPVDFSDPLGLRLDSPSDSKAARAFREALDYLRASAKAATVIDQLQGSPNHYKVVDDYSPTSDANYLPGDGYVSASRTIYWIPDLALRWKTGFQLKWREIPPAILLLHELGHAYHDDTEPARFKLDSRPYSDPAEASVWDKPEEKRTILEIEDIVEDQLHLPKRERHNFSDPSKAWAEHYTAIDPTKTQEKKNYTSGADDFSNVITN
jgi:hypothetical protein